MDQASVSMWKDGRVRPRSHLRKAIERATGISENDWLTTEERRVAEGRNVHGSV